MANKYKLIVYNVNSNEIIKRLCFSFNCGNLIIDNFLKGPNSLDSSICKTYLFVSCDDNNIINDLIGFFSLSTDAMLEKSADYTSGKIFNGSAIRISMFAIDKRYQQLKIKTENSEHTFASMMLLYCINRIEDIVKNDVGAAYIVLNSTSEGFNLYKHIGNFEVIDEDYLTPIHPSDGINCIAMYKPIFDIY